MYRGERLNALTHLIGSIASTAGLIALLVPAITQGDIWKIVSFAIYGASLIALYSASTLYHSIRSARVKYIFQKIDHCAIYLLIAGSYTPFTLITLRGPWGWSLFSVVWTLALIGLGLEIWFGRRQRKPSLLLYILMGWLILVACKPLVIALPSDGLTLLAAGGAIYSLGIYFYVNDRIEHYHGIWHLFVLGGSLCHFFCVLLYLAPATTQQFSG